MKAPPKRLRGFGFFRVNLQGMSLMEVVIAIGVVAVVIPLIFAATGSAGTSRRNAEADTRSAWIANEVRQEIVLSWGEHYAESVFGRRLNFPELARKAAPEILIYDSKGQFLTKGNADDLSSSNEIPDAAYLVSIYAEQYDPPHLPANKGDLCILRIRIIHPAKARPSSRSSYRYNLITSQQGTP